MSTEARAAKRRRTSGNGEEGTGSTQHRIAERLVCQIRNTSTRECFNALQDKALERDDIYSLACGQYKLHEVLLHALEAEASSDTLHGASFAHFMFNCLMNGTRSRRGGGIGSTDEQRALSFLTSDVAQAWPAWRHCTLNMVKRVFSGEVPDVMARDLLVMTVHALSHQSIAQLVLNAKHRKPTWLALKKTLRLIWNANESGIAEEVNPGSSLEAYVNTIAALLREQSMAIHGKSFTNVHLKVTDIGFVTSQQFKGKPGTTAAKSWMHSMRKYAMFSTIGVATARAHMEKRGTITSYDMNKHMEQVIAEDEIEEKRPKRKRAPVPCCKQRQRVLKRDKQSRLKKVQSKMRNSL